MSVVQDEAMVGFVSAEQTESIIPQSCIGFDFAHLGGSNVICSGEQVKDAL